MQVRLTGWARSAVAFAMIFGMGAAVEMTQPAFAQTSVTGQINGTVTDTTGAVVPNAAVTVKDTASGATLNLTSNADGRFTAPFLKPDVFQVSATAPGLQSGTSSVQVLVGQQTGVNVTLAPTASTQTVQVSANNAQLIDTQTSNVITTFTTQQFQNLPMPGGDITTIAYTVPGVVVNVGTGGYGNFTSDGIPGISNLVIINGADNNDPFLHLNNSGSSNLTIGQEEIAQSSIVQNGYSVQYGRQAGVIETYATKSGANRVHGLLNYQYNSSGLNANDFFNKQFGVPIPKEVSNQYAAQIGGPIVRNKLFFFADTEGIRYILPSGGYVNFLSPNLQNAILANVPAASVSTYTQMFKTFNGSPVYQAALNNPVTSTGSGIAQGTSPGGCGTLPTDDPRYAGFGDGNPCIVANYVNAANLNREYTITGRVDWNISDRHQLFGRVVVDNGQQPTFTSLIDPRLNDQSTQPTRSGQLNDTYAFTPNVSNQLVLSGLYYSAIFGPANLASTLAFSPTSFIEDSDGGTVNFTGLGQQYAGSAVIGAQYGYPFAYPQGRNVTQYQIVDGLSWLKGTHSIRTGFDFERDDVSDTGNQSNIYGGYYYFASLASLAGGTLTPQSGSTFNQAFTTVPTAHSAVYNFGVYAQDEWRARPNIVIDYGVRVDRTGNPLCNDNCYSHYVGGFPAANASLTLPYNQTISVGHGSAFPNIEKAIIQPRAGFNWDVSGQGKTVIRGGVGLFADTFPGVILTNLYGTFPSVFNATVSSGIVGPAGTSGTAAAGALASNNALQSGFAQGLDYNQISANVTAAGASFTPPNYFTSPNTFKNAKYVEYSMQLQRQITPTDAVIVSYAGNHGYDLLLINSHLNQTLTGSAYDAAGSGFDGLTTTAADPRFNEVETFTNKALSNYNGISGEYKHIDRHGLAIDASYTYSHALDDISNGGAAQFLNTDSVTTQITPNSVSALMYSNSDSDVRHSFVADVTYVEPYHFSNKVVDFAAGGWTIAGKAFWRSGEPFSVRNRNAENGINNGSGGVRGLAEVLNNNFNHTCNSYSSPCFQNFGAFNGTGYAVDSAGNPFVKYPVLPDGTKLIQAPQTIFGNVPRNAFYGPHYGDVDVTVLKALLHLRSAQVQVGAQAYNVLNHPNFFFPQNNASVPRGLGKINQDVSPPTSPYGSFQGSAVSGRVLVVQGRLIF